MSRFSDIPGPPLRESLNDTGEFFFDIDKASQEMKKAFDPVELETLVRESQVLKAAQENERGRIWTLVGRGVLISLLLFPVIKVTGVTDDIRYKMREVIMKEAGQPVGRQNPVISARK